ncbi:unnamed protein product, partial [Effrenium voratum]
AMNCGQTSMAQTAWHALTRPLDLSLVGSCCTTFWTDDVLVPKRLLLDEKHLMSSMALHGIRQLSDSLSLASFGPLFMRSRLSR